MKAIIVTSFCLMNIIWGREGGRERERKRERERERQMIKTLRCGRSQVQIPFRPVRKRKKKLFLFTQY